MDWIAANGEKLTIITMLLAAGYAGAMQWWVFGWVYKRQVQLTEEWKETAAEWKRLALEGMQTAQSAARRKRET